MDPLKKAVAFAAVDLISTETVVGLGSGSTLVYFIRELGARVRQGKLQVKGVPTSYQARMIAKESGIPLLDPMDVESIDITIDGADEVDPSGNLIKGAGGAHVVEKLVAALAKKFVVIVDESKQVHRLGERVAIPVEVIAPALSFAQRRLRELGGTPVVRNGNGKVGPVISDIGHPIIDVRFERIADPTWLDQQINSIPGVLGHGLFVNMADQIMIAHSPTENPRVETVRCTRKTGC